MGVLRRVGILLDPDLRLRRMRQGDAEDLPSLQQIKCRMYQLNKKNVPIVHLLLLKNALQQYITLSYIQKSILTKKSIDLCGCLQKNWTITSCWTKNIFHKMILYSLK